MEKILDLVITQFLSQLSSRWISFERSEPFICDIDLHCLSKAEWAAFMKSRLQSGQCKPSWVASFSRHFMGHEGYIADEIIHHLRLVKSYNAEFITYHSKYYPRLLKHIDDPPAALTCLGNLEILSNNLNTAMVGSRKACIQAKKEGFLLAQSLALLGHTIVSGGALGIDTAAHLGAISYKAPMRPSTIGVMAGGLGQLYPKSNLELFDDIRRNGGLLISEKLWHHSPRPMDFPIRNRIISGLCETTLLMQSAKASGSMVTADLALRQGRDVYVYLPNHFDQDYSGNLYLVENGSPFFNSHKDYLNHHVY